MNAELPPDWKQNYDAIGIQPDVGPSPPGLDRWVIPEWHAAQRRRRWPDRFKLTPPARKPAE